jgi:ABC-type sugar transport system permease subunit
MSRAVRNFHAAWFYVAVITTGLVGLWGIVLAILKREPRKPFHIAMGIAIGAMMVQVVIGVVLWQQGYRPGDGFHVFYGVVIAITLSLAYVYRAQMARHPAISYGLLMLFVMGLGLRAWANVG